MSGDSVLSIPCLGRPFQLGMLYDCRSDCLIPGVTLWNYENLKRAINSKPQLTSFFEVTAEDSINEKAVKLEIDPNMKVSFLAGLVNVSGAAKYLDDRRSSVNQARVSLNYKSTSRFEQLTMEQLGNLDHPIVINDQTATHLVTGVLYGADAIFVFDRHVSKDENYRDVHGSMEVMIRTLPNIQIGGNAELSITNTEKFEAEKFQCTFHGDLHLPENPSTFESAVRIYRKLPSLLDQKDCPKKVWLYPLSKLDSNAAHLVQNISTGLVSQAQSIMEEMHKFDMQSNDLKKSKVCVSFPTIQKQLSRFKEMISEYRTTFATNLATLVPQIRGGGQEEANLAKVFDVKHASPFCHGSLHSWIEGKMREVKKLEGYLHSMQGIEFVSPNDLDVLVEGFNYNTVICFTFKIAEQHDSYLDQMLTYLRTHKTNQENVNLKPWYEDSDLVMNIRKQAKLFRSFAEANEGNKDIKFVVTSNGDRGSSRGAAIDLYKDSERTENFNPPGKPGKPTASAVTHDTIQLKWSKPEYGAQSIQFYTVFYREENDPPNEWKETRIQKASNHYTVRQLVNRSCYSFKVRAESIGGSSLVSEVSVPIPTTPAPFNRMAVQMKNMSECIKTGPPIDIYKLPRETFYGNTTQKIAKYEVGSKCLAHIAPTEKILMMVGATGAGKSTLINGMLNYIMGVEWKDNFRFKLIVEESHTQSMSQTKWITAYTLHKQESSLIPYTLTIIDTPGFGDTEGLERDKVIASQIKEFFSVSGPCGIDHLDGIGIVIQSSEARLTPTQQYIFNSILAIFGKDVIHNIFLMITFSDGQPPQVLDAIRDAEIPYSKFFKFNSSALYTGNDDEENFSKVFWKMGFTSFKEFFTIFNTTESKSLQLTREVLNEREQLETTVNGLHPQIRSGLAKIEEMRQEEKVLQAHEADIATSKHFEYTVTVIKQRKVDISGKGIHVTNCLQCNFTCHSTCKIPRNENKAGCVAMGKDGFCQRCTGKCFWDKHVNNPYTFEEYEVTEQRNDKNLKDAYHRAMTGKTEVQSMMASIDSYLKDVHIDVLTKIKQVQKCLNRLDVIALRPNPLKEVEFLDLLIDSEKQQAKPGWMNRISYYQAAKQQAIILRNLQVKDVMKQLESIQERQVSESESWYDRFSWWLLYGDSEEQ